MCPSVWHNIKNIPRGIDFYGVPSYRKVHQTMLYCMLKNRYSDTQQPRGSRCGHVGLFWNAQGPMNIFGMCTGSFPGAFDESETKTKHK